MFSQPLHDRETIRASILKSRLDLCRLQRDLHDTVLMSQLTILQSRELIAKVDEALAREAARRPLFSCAIAPVAWRYSPQSFVPHPC